MSYLVSNTGAASVRASISHVASALVLELIAPPSTLVTPVSTGSSKTKSDVASSVALPNGEALRVTKERQRKKAVGGGRNVKTLKSNELMLTSHIFQGKATIV